MIEINQLRIAPTQSRVMTDNGHDTTQGQNPVLDHMKSSPQSFHFLGGLRTLLRTGGAQAVLRFSAVITR
jgi:hypothetical protein